LLSPDTISIGESKFEKIDSQQEKSTREIKLIAPPFLSTFTEYIAILDCDILQAGYGTVRSVETKEIKGWSGTSHGED